MAFIKGESRNQTVALPPCLDDYVKMDSPVRVIDALVDSFDLYGLGFCRSFPNNEGRPGYDPRDMLRLYIYGYFNKLRSSRVLARECTRNLEVMWLIGRLTPDFRTIADFRKNNADAIARCFKALVGTCGQLGLLGSVVSVDGSKFRAQNAKDNNFTASKLDDRIERADEHMKRYLEELDEYDEDESLDEDGLASKEALRSKIEELSAKKEKYEGYLKRIEDGEGQVSLTDPDSRLMKANEGFCVGYNVQSAVDGVSHLVTGIVVTNHPTDHGLLRSVVDEVTDNTGRVPEDVLADAGYRDTKDMADLLEGGSVPNVCKGRDNDGLFEIEVPYEPRDEDELRLASTDPEDIRSCLRSGHVPDIYRDVMSDMGIVEVTVPTAEDEACARSMDDAQMRDIAKEGFFVRDVRRDMVICPEGRVLRRKSARKDGTVRYANRMACKGCTDKCTKSRFRCCEFAPGQTMAASRHHGTSPKDAASVKPGAIEAEGRLKRQRRKVVRFCFRTDTEAYKQRKCLSEHPFGTIKRTLDGTYLLCRKIPKATAELSLSFFAYNLRRMINIVGFGELLTSLKAMARPAIMVAS